MEKKYTIELSESQMELIANCLEDISRFASGQCELKNTLHFAVESKQFKERFHRITEAEKLLNQVRKVLFPQFVSGQSYSYNSTEFIGNTYQIYRSIYYQLNKDSGIMNVYSSPALPSGNMGSIKINPLITK